MSESLQGSSAFKSLLKFGLAFFILFYLYRRGWLDPVGLKSLLRLDILLGGVLILGGVLVLASTRFWLLTKKEIRWLSSIRLTLIGVFFSYVIPGGVGGDVVKATELKKYGSYSLKKAAFVAFVDRLLGLLTMSAFSLLAFFFIPERLVGSLRLQWLLLFLAGVFVLVFIILGIFISSRWRKFFLIRNPLLQFSFLQKRLQVFMLPEYQKIYSWSTLLPAAGLSAISQALSVVLFVFLARQLYPMTTVPLSIHFFVVPIGFMTTAIPISPGGVGVGQAAFLFLYQKALGHMAFDFGSIGISGFQFYQLLWGVLGAIWFVLPERRTQMG
jgi:hypothetical protein